MKLTAAVTTPELLARYPSAVCLQFRNFPLKFHPLAGLAHEAAMDPSKIVRRDSGDPGGLRILLEHLPHDLLAQTFAPNSVGPVHGPEYVTTDHVGWGGPGVDCYLHLAAISFCGP